MGSRVITNYKMVRSGPIGCGSVAWMQPTSGPLEILVHYVGFVSLYRLRGGCYSFRIIHDTGN